MTTNQDSFATLALSWNYSMDSNFTSHLEELIADNVSLLTTWNIHHVTDPAHIPDEEPNNVST